jgi:hypothetical protein
VFFFERTLNFSLRARCIAVHSFASVSIAVSFNHHHRCYYCYYYSLSSSSCLFVLFLSLVVSGTVRVFLFA